MQYYSKTQTGFRKNGNVKGELDDRNLTRAEREKILEVLMS